MVNTLMTTSMVFNDNKSKGVSDGIVSVDQATIEVNVESREFGEHRQSFTRFNLIVV